MLQIIWEENIDNSAKRKEGYKEIQDSSRGRAKTSAPFLISQSETRKGIKKKKKKEKKNLKSLNQTLTFNSINAKYANVHPTDHYGIKS